MAVRRRGNRLVIDFYFYLPDGRKMRAVESEGPATRGNEARVHAKWKAVQYELKHGRFDYMRHFPHGSKARFLRPPCDMTYGEWWDKWFQEQILKFGTRRDYQYKYEKYLRPRFGHWLLQDVIDTEIAVFRRELLEIVGLKASTVNQVIKILCMPLSRAKKRGLIGKYACEDMGSLREDRTEMDPFSFEDLRAWLRDLRRRDPGFHDLIFFWSRTGLRPGEVYAMKWVHLDRFNRVYCVRESKQPSGRIDTPKTRHSVRDVQLSPGVIETLKRQEGRTGLHEFIWLNRGRLWNPFTMQGKFKFYLRLAGLRYRPPKQMRHTFATLNIAAGENISWVSRMLGHADVHTTLRRYNRWIPNLTRQDGSAFERLMEPENGNNLVTLDSKLLK